MAVHEYKCPCCSGALAFDSSVQKLKCPFCDTEFEVEAVKAYDEDLKNEGTDNLDWDTNAGTQWTVDEATGLRSYICQSCGGEIVGDENTAATDCPFCGNHAIIMQQFSGALKPDYVIPFKLDKEAAKAKYKQHLDQGHLRSLLAVRFRRRRRYPLPRHPHPRLVGFQLQLRPDLLLFRLPCGQHRL